MSVDRNEKIWAWSSTGNKMHAYLSGNPGSGLRVALCRSNITRPADAVVQGLDDLKFRSAVCPNCLKKAEAMWDRAEASMAPATEADDLGYVAPVDERKAALPPGMNRELLRQAKAVAEAHDRLFPKEEDFQIVLKEADKATNPDADLIEALARLRRFASTTIHPDVQAAFDTLENAGVFGDIDALEATYNALTKPTRWSYRFVTRHYSGRLVSSSRGYLEADSEAEAKAKVAALPIVMDPDFYAEGITVTPAN